MEFELRYSANFYNEINQAMNYAMNDLGNPNFASKLWDTAKEKAEKVRGNPYFRPIYFQDAAIAAKGYRWIAVCDFILFYRIKEGTNIIKVHSFIHMKRNISEVFNHEDDDN